MRNYSFPLFCVLLFTVGRAQAQTVLYTTNPSDPGAIWVTNNGSGNTAYNETGEGFQLGAQNATLTGFDVQSTLMYQQSGAPQFTDLHLLVTIFGGVQQNLIGVGDGDEFSDAEESAVYDVPVTWQDPRWQMPHGVQLVGTAANPYFTLPTPVSVPSGIVGIQFTWLGLVGGAYQPVPVQVASDISSAPLVGSNLVSWSGYQMEFRDLDGTDSSTPLLQNMSGGYTTDSLDVTLYGSATPEPSSIVLLSVGGGALMLRRRRVTR